MVTETSVGIDYHERGVQVCVMSRDGRVEFNRKVRNDIDAVVEAIGRGRTEVTVVAEACNGSATFLDQLHLSTGWPVRLCHPGYAQRMRANPDKTDKSDGELIADLTRVGYLPEVWLAPAAIRDLRALVRYRAAEIDKGRVIKLRIRALLRNNRVRPPEGVSLWTIKGRKWLTSDGILEGHSAWVLSRHLRELEHRGAEVKLVTKRIEEYVKGDSLCQKLIKHKGIGVVTSAIMRSEIGIFSRFKNGKQLARFCGVSPCNRSSGEIVSDSGVIRSGNTLLKSCLTQGAISLIRYDQAWRDFAQKLTARGKPNGVVICAVANRWIRRLFHEMK